MIKIPLVGLHARPNKKKSILMAIIPFLILVIAYSVASNARLTENPKDKLLPSAGKMMSAFSNAATKPDRRTGKVILWQDTYSSLKRLFIGVGLAAVLGLLLGLNMGLFGNVSAFFVSFTTVISMVPPLAILPILFLFMGVGELGKVALIFIGTFPIITRDIYLTVKKIPKEQIVKALTLGASQYTVVYRIILPQIIPRLINTLRLTIGAAWLFLIAAEAIASTDGLGYRIFLVRRYLSMDLIIPYVMWITLIGFCIDYSLRKLIDIKYPWYSKEDD